MADAVRYALDKGIIRKDPLTGMVASVSVGIYEGTPILDLDYREDSSAETDMNVVMNSAGQFVEVQGTAEGHAFSHDELKAMLELADNGIRQLFDHQKAVLGG
jgi:ribonuclease PH